MKILEYLNIKTDNIGLYETAFTHTSYTNENKVDSYERLEYLGDAVLELIMTEYLFKLHPEMLEGQMTKIRSNFVCENALFVYSTKLKLNEELKLGHGSEVNNDRYRKPIVADLFESFIGAMYLDKGLEVVKEFMYKHIMPIIESDESNFFVDYKSKLQELVQTEKRSVTYKLLSEVGPAHSKTYTTEVLVGEIVYGKGTGRSKKDAEMEAAKDALNKVAKND